MVVEQKTKAFKISDDFWMYIIQQHRGPDKDYEGTLRRLIGLTLEGPVRKARKVRKNG